MLVGAGGAAAGCGRGAVGQRLRCGPPDRCASRRHAEGACRQGSTHQRVPHGHGQSWKAANYLGFRCRQPFGAVSPHCPVEWLAKRADACFDACGGHLQSKSSPVNGLAFCPRPGAAWLAWQHAGITGGPRPAGRRPARRWQPPGQPRYTNRPKIISPPGGRPPAAPAAALLRAPRQQLPQGGGSMNGTALPAHALQALPGTPPPPPPGAAGPTPPRMERSQPPSSISLPSRALGRHLPHAWPASATAGSLTPPAPPALQSQQPTGPGRRPSRPQAAPVKHGSLLPAPPAAQAGPPAARLAGTGVLAEPPTANHQHHHFGWAMRIQSTARSPPAAGKERQAYHDPSPARNPPALCPHSPTPPPCSCSCCCCCRAAGGGLERLSLGCSGPALAGRAMSGCSVNVSPPLRAAGVSRSPWTSPPWLF